MRAFALTVGYIFYIGGLSAAIYVWATHWARDENDPIFRYRYHIQFFGLLAAVVGSAILILNGEPVPPIFRDRTAITPS